MSALRKEEGAEDVPLVLGVRAMVRLGGDEL